MSTHTFTSGYIVHDRPIGQVAYEAFCAACAKEPTALWSPRLPWDALPPERQQTWDDMANTVLEATLPY